MARPFARASFPEAFPPGGFAAFSAAPSGVGTLPRPFSVAMRWEMKLSWMGAFADVVSPSVGSGKAPAAAKEAAGNQASPRVAESSCRRVSCSAAAPHPIHPSGVCYSQRWSLFGRRLLRHTWRCCARQPARDFCPGLVPGTQPARAENFLRCRRAIKALFMVPGLRSRTPGASFPFKK
jgi:hypothetical protein